MLQSGVCGISCRLPALQRSACPQPACQCCANGPPVSPLLTLSRQTEAQAPPLLLNRLTKQPHVPGAAGQAAVTVHGCQQHISRCSSGRCGRARRPATLRAAGARQQRAVGRQDARFLPRVQQARAGRARRERSSGAGARDARGRAARTRCGHRADAAHLLFRHQKGPSTLATDGGAASHCHLHHSQGLWQRAAAVPAAGSQARFHCTGPVTVAVKGGG
mmetsp:Transcript_6237/g.15494  ORF Transcript_6237/g.15494 Transcript_6237/m.15494 type:complete len:219 (-) Transcript_6237:35-691(-)